MTASTLAPATQTHFNLAFVPVSEGMQSGTVSIQVKGTLGPVATIAVKGNGLKAPSSGMPELADGGGCAVGRTRGPVPGAGGILLLALALAVPLPYSLRRHR